MATYLLKADDADMDRWKAKAREDGLTFAGWCRTALDAYAVREPMAGPAPAPPLRLVPEDRPAKPHPKPVKVEKKRGRR